MTSLTRRMRKIQHCTRQLSDEQLWWRSADQMNSIANLMIHLAGNLRQWIVSGVGGAEDVRKRWKEFERRDDTAGDELLEQLAAAVQEAKSALTDLTPDELLRRRTIQGFDVTALQAIFESVAHFRGHSQEIVYMTRAQLGESYEFDFVPTGPEQGAPN